MWVPGLATLSELYAEDAVISGFSPPKQQTWSGIDNIRAVRKPKGHPYTLTVEMLTISVVEALQRDPAHRWIHGFQDHESWY
jgi:hypothetical protein